MSVLRTVRCDVCGRTDTEEQEGAGWPGWGQLMGVALDGVANPHLCPDHLANLADYADRLRSEQ